MYKPTSGQTGEKPMEQQKYHRLGSLLTCFGERLGKLHLCKKGKSRGEGRKEEMRGRERRGEEGGRGRDRGRK